MCVVSLLFFKQETEEIEQARVPAHLVNKGEVFEVFLMYIIFSYIYILYTEGSVLNHLVHILSVISS